MQGYAPVHGPRCAPCESRPWPSWASSTRPIRRAPTAMAGRAPPSERLRGRLDELEARLVSGVPWSPWLDELHLAAKINELKNQERTREGAGADYYGFELCLIWSNSTYPSSISFFSLPKLYLQNHQI